MLTVILSNVPHVQFTNREKLWAINTEKTLRSKIIINN